MKSMFVLALAATALSTAALAKDGSLADTIDMPRAAEAKVGFTLPLGGDRLSREQARYGASLGVSGAGPAGQRTQATLAALNFTGADVSEARFGGYDFASAQGVSGDDRLGFGSGSTIWIGVGIVIGVWAATELLGEDDD